MTNEYVLAPDLVAAAREFIRSEGDVSIRWLLDELSDKFGDRFHVSLDTYKVLDLIETLWADPDIHQPDKGWIEFYCDEKDPDPESISGFKALLLSHKQIPPEIKEET
jgi:hypothetical protein